MKITLSKIKPNTLLCLVPPPLMYSWIEYINTIFHLAIPILFLAILIILIRLWVSKKPLSNISKSIIVVFIVLFAYLIICGFSSAYYSYFFYNYYYVYYWLIAIMFYFLFWLVRKIGVRELSQAFMILAIIFTLAGIIVTYGVIRQNRDMTSDYTNHTETLEFPFAESPFIRISSGLDSCGNSTIF